MTEREPYLPVDDEQLGNPASSHGSDLKARVGSGQDEPDQIMGVGGADP